MSTQPTIAILAALADEIAPTLKLLDFRLAGADGTLRAATFRDAQVITKIAGMGPARIEQAMADLHSRFSPRSFILIGFCGGLDPSLRTGDILHVETVINEKGRGFRLNDEVPEAVDVASLGAVGLLTVEKLADSPERKRELFKTHGAAAVDMETFFAARFAAQHHLNLTVIRAVTDPADMALPAESVNWVTEDGLADAGAAMRYLALHPWKLPALLALRKNAHRAAKSLAQAVEKEAPSSRT